MTGQHADLVSLSNFTLTVGGRAMFSPIHLSLAPGESVSLQGENGAGKSSLLKVLAGLPIPWAEPRGEAVILGLKAGPPPAKLANRGLLLLRQQPTRYAGLNVMEQLLVASVWHSPLRQSPEGSQHPSRKTLPRALLQELLATFGLDGMERAKVANLSPGQIRRLGLASGRLRLSLGTLRLIVLDEPFSGLDDKGRVLLADFLVDSLSGGCAAIIAEHVGEGLEPLGKRLVELSAGEVMQS